jgi:DNA-binding response OmpR family regulator
LPKRILVVEDDATIRDTLGFNLKKEGYQVSIARDGAEALTQVRSARPDLVLLDLMLPELNGLEVCRIIRQESNVPIIMLTAKESEVDKIVGLQLGADDYITKPFSLRELFARMTAVMRRSEQQEVRPEVEEDRLGRLRIDRAGRRAMIDDNELKLTPKEWDLLAYLVRRPGRVFTREILLEQVWGYNYMGDRKTVDVHIRWLREKLSRFGKLGFAIVTVRGAGYRLDPVREGNEPRSPRKSEGDRAPQPR